MAPVDSRWLRVPGGAFCALLVWALVGSLLVIAGSPGATNVVSAAARVSEGGVDGDGERVLAGVDRYATSVALAERATDAGADGGMVVVSGESLVDALSAVPLAAATSSVVVLTRTAELPEVVARFVRSHDPQGVSVVGGESAVSAEVADELGALAGLDAVERFAGHDRYETAVKVAGAAGVPGGWCGEPGPAVVMVNPQSLVDGVLAAPVAYAMGLPVLFTPADALPDVVREYLTEAGVARAVLIGSEAQVSLDVEDELAELGVAVRRIDGQSPAARSVALADAVAACGAASTAFALLDATVPVDGVAAAALLAHGIEHSGTAQLPGSPTSRRVVPMLAVDSELPTDVAEHLSARGAAAADVMLYALGGTTRITPQLMADAIAAADSATDNKDASVTSNSGRDQRRTQRAANRRASSASGASENVPSLATTQPAGATTAPPLPGTTSTTSSTSSTTTTEPPPPSSSTTTEPPPPSSTTTTSSSTTSSTTTEPPPPRASAAEAAEARAFTSVSAGGGHSCAVRNTGSIVCWGSNDYSETDAPSGAFVAVVAGWDHSCGRRVDGTIACWGDNRRAQSFSPPGEFRSLAAGRWHSCGVRTDGAVTCWGDSDEGRLDAPSGSFASVSAGFEHSCGLRTDGTIVCWGANAWGRLDAPSGAFIGVDTGYSHSCGVRADGTVTCWGGRRRDALRVPSGTFTAVSVGDEHSCGLRTDGAVVCWGGSNDWGQLDVPSGTFSSVSSYGVTSCGLRTDGAVACWGGLNDWGRQDVPTANDRGIEASVDERSACRPPGPEGFPHTGLADVSDGTLDVLVVFAEFGDARHDPVAASWEMAEAHLDAVEAYIEAQSYGQLDVVFTDLGEWVTIGESYEDYLRSGRTRLGRSGPLDAEAEWQAVMEAKARGVDVTRGGARFDSLLLIAPPSHFHGGVAARNRSVPTDDEPEWSTLDSGAVLLRSAGAPTIRSVAHSGTFPRPPAERQPGQQLPVFVTAHELMHNLGLQDLYALDAIALHGAPSSNADHYVEAVYGRMGLRVFWPAKPDAEFGTPIPGPAYPATGIAVAGVTVLETRRAKLDEALGWSRWRMDWLDASQVACVEPGESTVELASVANPADGTALAVVPISPHELLVLEARRRVGYDADRPGGTAGTFVRHLSDEGVLAYVVDPRRGSGDVPIETAGDDGTGLAPHDPILAIGDTFTLGDDDGGPVIDVTVTDDDGTEFAVEIDWRAGTTRHSLSSCDDGAIEDFYYQAGFDTANDRNDLVLRWKSLDCMHAPMELHYSIFSFPHLTDASVTRRIESSHEVTVAAGQTSFAVEVPDSPFPLIVKARLNFVDVPFSVVHSGLVCPHRDRYTTNVRSGKLAKRIASASDFAAYESACGSETSTSTDEPE